MDLSNYLLLKPELSLIVLFVILLTYDLFASDKAKKYYFPIACTLFLAHTVVCFFFNETGTSFAGMYITGPAQHAIKCILNIGVFLILLQANEWLSRPESIAKRGEFFALTLLTLFGMYFMISSGHFLSFFIGLETASLPIAALVAFDKNRRHSAEGGVKFIFSAVFSSAIFLFGLSFLYGATGSLYYTDITHAVQSTPLFIMALVMMTSGLFFKISLVPFHLWAADTYEGAPTTVTLYLSTISKGAAVFALMMILYIVYPVLAIVWKEIIWALIILTITIGNLFAIRQKNMKRFFAFSSISQAGYIMLSVFAGTPQGMAATLYYIFVYLFSNAAVFGVISAIENKTGRIRMDEYHGMYKANPKLAIVMMIALFSLGGIPFTAGFFSKLFVFMAALQQGMYIVVFIALLNTVVSLYYYLLVVKAMFITPTSTPVESFKTDKYLKISLVLSLIGILFFGLISYFYEYLNTTGFGLIQ